MASNMLNKVNEVDTQGVRGRIRFRALRLKT